jgi:putative transposase
MPIAPSAYYARRTAPVSAAELADAYAANALVALYRANRGLYGVRKLWHAARRARHRWGRDQVGRLVRVAGIDGVRRGRRSTTTTRRHQSAPRHPDLIDRAWATPSRLEG